MLAVVYLNNPENSAVDVYWAKKFTSFLEEQKISRLHFIAGYPIPFSIKDVDLISKEQIKTNRLMPIMHQQKIKQIIRKMHADLFFSTDEYIGKLKEVRQFQFIADDLFLKSTRKKNSLLHSPNLIASADWIKSQLISLTGRKDQEILSHEITPDEIKSWTYAEQAEFLTTHTDDKSYFLYLSLHKTIDPYIVLLKSFSAFKQWNRSEMKLVICIKGKVKMILSEKLKTYKYKKDVVLIEPTEADTFIPAAMAALHIPDQNRLIQSMIDCWTYQVPLMLLDHPFYRSFCNDCACFTSPDEKSIGKHMILLYKDDSLKTKLNHALEKRMLKTDQLLTSFIFG